MVFKVKYSQHYKSSAIVKSLLLTMNEALEDCFHSDKRRIYVLYSCEKAPFTLAFQKTMNTLIHKSRNYC